MIKITKKLTYRRKKMNTYGCFGTIARTGTKNRNRLAETLYSISTAESSTEPGCPYEQIQSRSDDDDARSSCDEPCGRCESFDGDDRRYNSHRAKVHDSDHQEDRHQTGTTAAAVQAQMYAVSQGRVCVGWQRMFAAGYFSAAD